MENKPRYPSDEARFRLTLVSALCAVCVIGLCLAVPAGSVPAASSPRNAPASASAPAPAQDSPSAAPYQAFIHAEMEGFIQALAVSDTALVLDVELRDGTHRVKAYSQPDGRLLWDKPYVNANPHQPGPALHIFGGRLAFVAAETAPSSSSIGLHVLDLQTGAKLHYTRESVLAARGPRIVSQSGGTGNVYDISQGTYLKKYTQAERLRFKVMAGDKVLYLRSVGDDKRTWTPMLLSLADGSESWTNRQWTAEELAFIRDDIASHERIVTDGFPVLIRQKPPSSKSAPAPVRFCVLTESGPCRFFTMQDFGLSRVHAGRPSAVVDFQHAWGSGRGAVVVAGVASPLSAVTYHGSDLALVVFDVYGNLLGRVEVPLNGTNVSWSGLDDRGRLILVLGDERVLAYQILPILFFKFVRGYGDLRFSGRGMARMMGQELYAWGFFPSRPFSGQCVFSLTTEAGDLAAFYPFDRGPGNLADFKTAYLDAFNSSHLFLCFVKSVKVGGNSGYRSTVVRIPRENKGWLDASLSVPPPVYTDSAVPVTFAPPVASLSASGGSISGKATWNTPSAPGTYVLTLSIGQVTREFPVEVTVKPVNKPPAADFILVDPSEADMWRLETYFDGSASNDPDGRIVKYEWSYQSGPSAGATAFGGSSAKANVLFSSTWSPDVSIPVTLKVTDDKGLTAAKTRRVFPPVAMTVKRETDGKEFRTAVPPAFDPETGLTRASYRVEVETGTLEGAGTDANVLLMLYGAKRADGMRLRSGYEWDLQGGKPEDFLAQFENGRKDTFTMTGVSLDSLDFITLRHTNGGGRPGWHVKSLSVKNMTTGKEWHFLIDQWLAFSEGPSNRTWYRFAPLESLFSSGIVFGSTRHSAGLTAASDNVFILDGPAQEFYITSTRRDQEVVVMSEAGVVLGRRTAVGSGEAEFPKLKKEEWGVKLKASDFARPTPLTVRLGSGGDEALIWIFPSSWKGYESTARKLALLLPLEGRVDGVFAVALGARDYLRESIDKNKKIDLNPIIEYGAEALALFEDVPDLTIKGFLSSTLPRYALKYATVAAELMGYTVAAAAGELSAGLLLLIDALEWAESTIDSISKAAAPGYANGLLKRMADGLDSNLLQLEEIFRVLKAKTNSLLTDAAANKAASCRSTLADIRLITIGPNPDGGTIADTVITYSSYGITRMTGISNQLCLAALLAQSLESIKYWRTNGHSDFDSDWFKKLKAEQMYGLDKVAATGVAMDYYQPVIEAMIKAAAILIGAAALE